MIRHQFEENKIIILLGAGASCDAGMKNSFQMITEIESKLNSEWNEFKNLYNYIQSSHYHLQRIKGIQFNDISFNIEDLVSLLDSIIKIKNKQIDIYPFVGSWEKELQQVAGVDLTLAFTFKRNIIDKLKNVWLSDPEYKRKSSYYKYLTKIGYNHPLKIFSLNYDMCVEDNFESERIQIERGFSEHEKTWDYKRYNPKDEDEINYFLYKLHGSLDWKRDEQKRLIYVDNYQSINAEDLQIIFGIQNKLQSYDPYLFYFYSFRDAAIDAELIIVSGYGFMDEHINENLKNAFKLDNTKKLLVNILDTSTKVDFEVNCKKFISSKIDIKVENIILCNEHASDFFVKKLNMEYLANIFPVEDEYADLLPTGPKLE